MRDTGEKENPWQHLAEPAFVRQYAPGESTGDAMELHTEMDYKRFSCALWRIGELGISLQTRGNSSPLSRYLYESKLNIIKQEVPYFGVAAQDASGRDARVLYSTRLAHAQRTIRGVLVGTLTPTGVLVSWLHARMLRSPYASPSNNPNGYVGYNASFESMPGHSLTSAGVFDWWLMRCGVPVVRCGNGRRVVAGGFNYPKEYVWARWEIIAPCEEYLESLRGRG